MTEVCTPTPDDASPKAVKLTERPTLPPVRCATWCDAGDGHPRETHISDQYCYSIYLTMPTSLHGPEGEEDLDVLARKESDGSAPYVVIRTPDDTEVRLTVHEVQRLTDYLKHAAWMAEQDAHQRNAFELGVDFGKGERSA